MVQRFREQSVCPSLASKPIRTADKDMSLGALQWKCQSASTLSCTGMMTFIGSRHGSVPVKRDASHGWHELHCFTGHCFGGCRLELIGQKLRYILSEECTPVFASCNLLLLATQFFSRSSSFSDNRSEMAFAGRCCSS